MNGNGGDFASFLQKLSEDRELQQTYAKDPSESMRQLIATILSRTGDAKWTSTLITLVQDKEPAVGRLSGGGLFSFPSPGGFS